MRLAYFYRSWLADFGISTETKTWKKAETKTTLGPRPSKLQNYLVFIENCFVLPGNYVFYASDIESKHKHRKMPKEVKRAYFVKGTFSFFLFEKFVVFCDFFFQKTETETGPVSRVFSETETANPDLT